MTIETGTSHVHHHHGYDNHGFNNRGGYDDRSDHHRTQSNADHHRIQDNNNHNRTQDQIGQIRHDQHIDTGFSNAMQDRSDHALNNTLNHGFSGNALATERNGAASQLAIEKIGAAAQIAVEKTSAAALLAVEKTAAAIKLDVEKVGAANQLATEKIGAAVQLEALRNRSDILAELCKCCCEIKAGQAETRALVLSVESNRVRDQLAETRTELLIANAANR